MTFTLAQWCVLFPVAILLSMTGTLVGLGGGVFMVPLLVLLFAVPLKIAIASVTISLLPAALLSTFFNARARHIDYTAGVLLEIPTVLGALLGTMLTTLLPVRPMEMMFAGLVAFMGWRILYGKTPLNRLTLMDRLNLIPPVIERVKEGYRYRAGLPAIGIFGFISGLLAGLFGIGGGLIKVPVMLKVFRMPARRATATALFTIIFTSATATYSHWQLGRMDWHLALPLGSAFFIGSLVGNAFVKKIPASALEKILGVVLLASSIAIGIHVWMFK